MTNQVGASAGRTITVAAVTWLLMFGVSEGQQSTSFAPQVYSQGNPTNEEQYLLERLNRARLDPVGESQHLAAWLRATPVGQGIVSQYGTNPDQVASDFAALLAAQPLAFNADLITAARGHSTDIASHNGEGPNDDVDAYWSGTNGSNAVYATGLRDVMGNNAYFGETAFGDVPDLDTIHAGYLIDWGTPDLGHRKLEMNTSGVMTVVGMGVETQPDTRLSDTELYGAGVSKAAFLTGVVYNDADGNGLYDVGEGVAGVMVTVDGGAYSAATSASGGYALPLVAPDGSSLTGAVTVHMFNLPDGSTREATVTVKTVTLGNGYVDPLNVKWDVQTLAAINPAGTTLSGGGTLSRVAKGKVLITVQRPAGSTTTQPLPVALAFKGSAVAGVDYQALPAIVTIPAGAQSLRLKVKALLGDPPAWTPQTTLTIKVKGEKGAQAKATVTIVP